jgi:endoglucanase
MSEQSGHIAPRSRRGFLAICLGGAALTLGPAADAAADQNWPAFKRRFIHDGERVVDTGNDNVSHSEGQGWGMLFAESNDDRQAFLKLWGWTSASLQRDDRLFSWRWSAKTADPVADKNNAADGDILIAWALARAARRWSEPRLGAQSRVIQAAILAQLTAEVQGRLTLLPGMEGFARKDFRVVNLSYYVWPALADFARSASDPAPWRRLEADGLWVLDRASFGIYHLPPDWLLLGDRELKIADGWPPYFGFDAVRIPLYLAWRNDARRLGRFLTAWRTPKFDGRPPAWINLRDGSVAPFAAPAGYDAIFAVAQFVASGLKNGPPTSAIADSDDYYSASLKLLSNLAAEEAGRA